ncbi:MAG: Putative arginyl-tRNA--protein transferase [Candidatus Tokpelaia hoelldobleri]|uniref:Aspartate/glutamate leucyltransferase n=1 Tax=Candidatus Tokpelaia hoelldobleri TaxID=1902579 RepID=A0A1U9JUV8_9HYPH|nr:MAG: Putative arginyl-tRNA--protein transferase [Candidatus Tokpelaia hoelldoblerii]
MTEQTLKTGQFYITAPSPCPYLAEKFERKVFTPVPPVAANAAVINAALTLQGFRRSQNIIYRPLCEGCQACVSVRVPVAEFKPDKTMRRLYKTNADIVVEIIAPQASQEQYTLFKAYLAARHATGSMADMTFSDYAMMVGDSAVNCNLIEYRRAPDSTNRSGKLVGVALTDNLPDGCSMVYSFYDPAEKKRSLGTYIILEHIHRTAQNALPYVYLGYWVEGSDKMHYKIRFQPQEHLGKGGWRR